MTEPQATASDTGALIYALAGFLRSSVPTTVGPTTLHLVADRAAWDRLLQAAAKVTTP